MATIPYDFERMMVSVDTRWPAHATQDHAAVSNSTSTRSSWEDRLAMISSQASTSKILFSDGHIVPIEVDEMSYLKYEAERRGISIQDVYEEERAAEKRVSAKAISRETLKRIARCCTPDSRYLDVDDDPF